MNRIGTMMTRLAFAASALAFSLPGFAAVDRWKLNMTPGVTEVSQQVYDIHMIILWICIVIGVLVFAGLTAWDTQKIKEMYFEADDAAVAGRKAIMGALTLYLDFINLFLFLLRFLGNRE